MRRNHLMAPSFPVRVMECSRTRRWQLQHCKCTLCMLSRSVVSDSTILWTIAHQAPPSMGFSKQKYWSGLPCQPPGDLSQPRDQTCISCLSCMAGRFFTAEPAGKPMNAINATELFTLKWLILGTSLLVQWLRIYFPIQGMRV